MFDSGLGGLTVLDAIRALAPDLDVVYFADTIHVPIGDRPLEQIAAFGYDNVQHLLQFHPAAIVIACGSTCSAFDAKGSPEAPVPLLGIVEPGAREATALSRGKAIGVIATAATIAGGVFERAIRALAPDARVTSVPAPALVPIVEDGDLEGERARRAVAIACRPLVAARCDAVILGCTHYPHLRRWFVEALGPSVMLIDPALATARELVELLGPADPATTGSEGAVTFEVSADAAAFAALAERVTGERLGSVRQVDVRRRGDLSPRP